MDASHSEAKQDDHQITLVVDLDGTLCLSDTLHEAVLALVAARPRWASLPRLTPSVAKVAAKVARQKVTK